MGVVPTHRVVQPAELREGDGALRQALEQQVVEITALRRLIRESIQAGIAGIRIDDQPIEGKRATQTAGIEVVDREQAIARYRAAVDMRNELDPNFVIMAQCYTRDAANGGLDECLSRLQAYEQEAGVDWVQFESPHSVEELAQARAVVKGPMSFMKGKLPRYLTLKEHLDLGYTIAWIPSFTHHVTHQALWEFMQDFQQRDIGAWDAYLEDHKGNPYRQVPHPLDETPRKQRILEERYFSADTLHKYEASPGGML